MKTNLPLLLQVAGFLHLGLISAGLIMPRAIGLKPELAALTPFVRNLFWTYYLFVGFTIASFGLLTWFFAEILASGNALGRSLCLVMALFWIFRGLVAGLVLKTKPFLTTPFHRIGNATLNIVFLYLALVYTWAFLKGIL